MLSSTAHLSRPTQLESINSTCDPSHGSHTLYLHIGLHKTGTSAFQRIAALVGDTQSIVYPDLDERVEGDYSHNVLIGYMQSHRIAMGQTFSAEDFDEPLTHDMRILIGLFRDKWRSKSVILSAEEFSNEWHEEKHALKWHKLFSTFDAVRIAIVLRRYDHLFNSVASEIVKTSFHGNMLVDKSSAGYASYDISALLRTIRSFGWQVDIFSYDRLAGQQALIPQLLTWCGMARSDMPGELLTTRINRKFHRRKALFCSLLDKSSLPELKKIALVNSICSCTAIADDGEEYLYSPQELDDFYAYSKQLNARSLASEGILDIDDFFNYQPLTPNIKWTPPSAPTVAEINAARDEIMADTGIDIRDICLDPASVYPLH